MPGPDDVFRSCLDLRWHFNPAAATTAGLTTQDQRLGSYDSASMRAHLAAHKSLAGALEELEVDDIETEIDRTALLSDLRATIHRFEHETPHVRNPAFWLGHLYQALYGLLVRTWDDPGGRGRALMERLRGTPAFLRAAEETLEDPPPILIETAAAMIDGGAALLGRVAAACRTIEDLPEDEVNAAAGEAEAALARFSLELKAEPAGEPGTFAVGEEQFNRRLHFEHAINATAPELWRYGLHLVEEVQASLEALAREADPARSWRDQIEQYRAEAPVRGDRIGAYRAAMDRARQFVRDHDLVAIPEGGLEVLPTPDFLRPIVPFAAYWPPGPYAPDRTGRFFVTVSDGVGSLGRSASELASTALHEGYPGHHLHILTQQGLGSEVRRVVSSPVTLEGWALYCEELMAEEGFYATPAERLFQQMHLLWRAVRILLDIGLHTRGMSADAATVFLLDRIPIQPAEARAEVRRCCTYPAYQVCYALGWREIRSLRDDFRARAGSSYTPRAFHDAFLRYGGLPVSYARWGMGLDQG